MHVREEQDPLGELGGYGRHGPRQQRLRGFGEDDVLASARPHLEIHRAVATAAAREFRR
eukprot:CAMPEP_0114232658 /NCGR_PEP_ID=MMETSP0058-20121206/4732_1 /TAXON_ID=36894 /ORGANISM="Pyramimonas parkeae, CCMP726" /LENGTH=58 /DNA_ID=CAMNT_0001344163 /DNA_START=854 /DNA_END=1026 /DNA_ORIENTATION=-